MKRSDKIYRLMILLISWLANGTPVGRLWRIRWRGRSEPPPALFHRLPLSFLYIIPCLLSLARPGREIYCSQCLVHNFSRRAALIPCIPPFLRVPLHLPLVYFISPSQVRPPHLLQTASGTRWTRLSLSSIKSLFSCHLNTLRNLGTGASLK